MHAELHICVYCWDMSSEDYQVRQWPASGFCPVTFDLLPTLLRGPLPHGLIG